MKPIRFHRLARREMLEASDFYDHEAEGLGDASYRRWSAYSASSLDTRNQAPHFRRMSAGQSCRVFPTA